MKYQHFRGMIEERSDALREIILSRVPLARPGGEVACRRFGDGLSRAKVSAINLTLESRKMGFRAVKQWRFARAVATGLLCPLQATIVTMWQGTWSLLNDRGFVWSVPQDLMWGVVAARVQPMAVRPGSKSRQYLNRDTIDAPGGSNSGTCDKDLMSRARAMRIVKTVRDIHRDPEYVLHPFTRFHGAAAPLRLEHLDQWILKRQDELLSDGGSNV